MISTNGNAPTANQGASSKHNPSRLHAHCSGPADLILSRLGGVQQAGQGWRARCPAHGSDKNRSLSVAVAEDGRALLHCFGGCGAADVLQAIGLELKDLYPERITHVNTKAEARKIRENAKAAQWAAALDVLALEARILAVAGDQIATGETLNECDRERLALALERITGARLVLNGR